MKKLRPVEWVIFSIAFSILMNLPTESGLGLFALVMVVLPLIAGLVSLIVYFILNAAGDEFKVIGTILACCINVYCGLMLRLDLPVPFE